MHLSKSLVRGLPRMVLLAFIGGVCLMAAHLVPQLLGATLAPLSFGFGLCFVGLAVGDLALRILQPHVDTQDAADRALRQSNQAAGLVYLGRCVLAGVILILVVTASRAAEPPQAALLLLPTLKAEQTAYWPAMPLPAALGAQVEQETCTSLKSRSCWSPAAELRTSREQGVGLGQLTRAFRADGSVRFDALTELVQTYPRELQGLSWAKHTDPSLQLRALVLKDRQGYDQVDGADTELDRLAMAFAAYNGGAGGLASDRVACAGTPGCDPGRWFGHVERTSLKAKAAVPGYGKSFFAINREYVRNIMVVRTVRYEVLNV